MTNRVVDPELRTGWDDQPVLTVINKRNESIRLVLEFVTSPGSTGSAKRWSRVQFNVVCYYRWIAMDALVKDFLARGARFPGLTATLDHPPGAGEIGAR